MKCKKLILLISLFILSFIYIIHPYMLKERDYGDIIRFHIRANSDREEDQQLKLKIRDNILEEMNKKFENIETIEESREVILDNMDEMKSITERVIREEGKDYTVAISLGQDNFPTRKYGELVFPQGEYETLLITLGEGSGQNWWCVMFPPLCFIDITHSIAYNGESDIKQGESPKELKLKWKTKELIENRKNKRKKLRQGELFPLS